METAATTAGTSQTSEAISNTSTSAIEKLTGSIKSISNGQVSEGTLALVNEFLLPAAGGLLALLAAYFLAKFLSRQVRRMVVAKVDETLGKFAGKLVFYGIAIVSITVILPTVGVEVSGLMAILATAGFAIGLAFQGTLSNFSAGVLLLVFRPFRVGDSVNIAGLIGKVDEIDIFTTTLDTPDNRRMIIPNSSIAGNTIENMTFHEHRRVEVTVGVEYAASLDRTREALIACAESLSDCTVQGEDRGYQVILANLADSSVQWTVRIWVAKDQFLPCKERLTVEIKRFLDKYEIGIPYPQLRVHLAQLPKTIESGPVAGTAASRSSLSIPNIHPPEDHRMRIRPRVRGESLE